MYQRGARHAMPIADLDVIIISTGLCHLALSLSLLPLLFQLLTLQARKEEG